MKLNLLGTVALLTVASGALMADAIPYPNTGTIAPVATFTAASSGPITAYFYQSTAQHSDDLGLFVNGTQVGAWGLNNHSSAQGQSYVFGNVAAGTQLTFAIRDNTAGYQLYSTPSLNQDNTNHVYSTAYTGGVSSIPAGTFVGFEDLLANISDFNYNDETFVFTNVASSSTTPEPGSLLLLSAGLAGLGILGRRRARKS